jgi:cupin fold WbuC family metalloprotein
MTDLLDRWVARGSDVFYPRPGVVAVTSADVAALKERAAASPRGRCRICLHGKETDILHDMVIVLYRGAYDRPHRHLVKVETMIAIEGAAVYLRFAADGTPIAADLFSAGNSGARVLRTPAGEFHALMIVSEWLVFCESTLGPFDPGASEFAPWSPAAEETTAVARYLSGLAAWADGFADA